MCTVQSISFILNGVRPDSSTCRIEIDDIIKIETEVIVTFASGDIDKIVKVGAYFTDADGNELTRWSANFTVIDDTTETFVMDITALVNSVGLGDYVFTEGEVRNTDKDTVMCNLIIS